MSSETPSQKMHVLTVLDHPNPASFTAAVAHAFMTGAAEAGHQTELADLHAEGFDPRGTQADIEADETRQWPPDIVSEHRRLEHADAVCLVFPLFWWGMPAMTKGWVERVWAWGWAYDQLGDTNVSLQKPRTGILLVPAGARSDEMAKKGYTEALETSWIQGTFGYFGFTNRKLVVLNGAEGSAERRQSLLHIAQETGRLLEPPT